MISIALSFVLLFFFFLGIGALIQKIGKTSIHSFCETLLIGIIGAISISLISGFYTDLGLEFEIFLMVISLLGLYFGRNELQYLFRFKKHYFNKWFFVLGLLSLFIISFAPFILDHFGYYLPTITVLNQVGLQTGIANIELVLGQQSIWHYLQASIDQLLDTQLRLNGFLLIWYLMYVFEKKDMKLLFFLPFFWWFSQSPSPDLAIYVLSIYVIYEWFFNSKKSIGFLLIISAFVVFIKPTAFWLPLFIGGIWLYNAIQKRKWSETTPIILVVVFGILVMLKNYLASSNLLFPIGDFYVDTLWKPDAKIIEQSSRFALQKGYNFEYDYEDILQFSFSKRVLAWLQLSGFKGILNMAVLLISAGYVYWILKYKREKYYFLTFVLVLKLVLVFWISAQQRFMWDAIIIMILLFIHHVVRRNLVVGLSTLGMIAVAFVFIFPMKLKEWSPSFKLSQMMQGFQVEQIIKPVKYELEYDKGEKVGNLEFQIPKDYPFLYDVPFVALSYSDLNYYLSLGKFPQWEGDVLIMKPLGENQEKELSEILKQKNR